MESRVNSNTKSDHSEQSLIDIIKQEAKGYLKREEFLSILDEVKERASSRKYSKELTDLYEISVSFLEKYGNDIPGMNVIGGWLSKNEGEYFAKVEKTEETYEEEDIPSTWSLSAIYSNPLNYPAVKSRMVPKIREHIAGISLTEEVPYKAVKVDATPLFENLKAYSCIIVYIFSKKEITLFNCVFKYLDYGWTSRTFPKDGVQWKYSTSALNPKENVSNSVERICYCSLVIPLRSPLQA